MFGLHSHRGFTLLELILVIVLIGILGAAVTPVAFSTLRAKSALVDVGVTLDQVRYASDRMAFEIRELGAGSITAITPTSFTFGRTDYAGVTTSRTVKIDQTSPSYETVKGVSTNQCNGTITLSYSDPATGVSLTPAYLPILTNRMCSLTFAYYDQTGTVTGTPANVRFVEFKLELAATAPKMPSAPATEPPAKLPYSQRARVALRNQ